MQKLKHILVKERDYDELMKYCKRYNVRMHTMISRLLDSYFADIINTMNDFDKARDYLIKQGFTPTDIKTEPEE